MSLAVNQLQTIARIIYFQRGEFLKNFKWTDELSVNIDEIDSQHKEFIKLTNELSDAIIAGKEEDIIEETLSTLIGYANMHFASEERLMKIHGYPDLAMHKKEHSELKETILKLNHRFNTGQLAHAATIAVFLEGWITNHLQTIDKEYSSFLNSKGVF